MASFINILKKIGGIVIGVEHAVAPVAETMFPAFSGPIAAIDDIFQRLQATITSGEVANPAPGQGAAKSVAAVTDFEAALDFTQQILALEGKKLTYDSASLQDVINKQVAAFNAMSALKTSFKIVAV